MIISRTPFRISFFGGGTDYPSWYRENPGAVLGATINKYCYVTCRYLPPFFDYKSRLIYSRMEHVVSTEQIQHPAIRETFRFLGIQDGIELHHDGDLPARTGLGSSSTFTVGLLNALYALRGVMPGKMRLAREAIHIEQEMIGENVGSQDQTLAAFGGLLRIDFLGDHEIHVSPIVMDAERIQSLQDHLLLVFTGFSRNASEIAGEQVSRTRRNGTSLKAMYDMVLEAVRVLNAPGDLTDFGKLLHESWCLKRTLSPRITMPQIDEIYDLARTAGAVGGKLLGAGGGGFVLLFVRPDDQPRVRQRLAHFLCVPFRFENSGSQIIFYDPDSLYRPIEGERS
jgi:D-glycero-alpha-D-manno-heptose-7-phosphate kinase